MTTYTDIIKSDSFPSFELTTGFKPITKLDSLPLFEPTTGFKPAVKVIYYEGEVEGEDRPTSGQIYPRSL